MNQQDPQASGRVALRTCSYIVLAVNLILTVVITCQIVSSRTGMCKILADFGSVPPLLSQMVLSWWYPWILPVLAVIGVAKEWTLRNRYMTLIWNGVHVAVAIAVWQLYVEGGLRQLLDLIQKLGG
jgi:hypothetical protein